MKTCLQPFNIYLLALALFAGCATSEQSKQKKEQSTVRLHLEAFADGTGRNGQVPVTQQKIMINVEGEAFLTEGDLVDARLIDGMGGFEIELFFDSHGALVLDMVTSSSKGKRVVILVQYPQPKPQKQFSRWVAARVIDKRVANGVWTFTPDLSREEAERIVRGLKNVVAKSKKASKF